MFQDKSGLPALVHMPHLEFSSLCMDNDSMAADRDVRIFTGLARLTRLALDMSDTGFFDISECPTLGAFEQHVRTQMPHLMLDNEYLFGHTGSTATGLGC